MLFQEANSEPWAFFRLLPRTRLRLADGAPVALGGCAADRAKLATTDQKEATTMITNGETNSALDQVSVPRHNPSQLRWEAQDAALEFGRFRMLIRRRQMIADGIPVRVGTRAFDLLTVLLEADGSLVAKVEILSRVWPGIYVSDENLKVQISVLRKALGKDRGLLAPRSAAATVSLRQSSRLHPGVLFSMQRDTVWGRVEEGCHDG